jgi:multidrug efflux pump
VLIEAVVIVLAVSFISLGLHFRPLRIDIWPGLVVGITIPLVLAITFVTMYYWGVGLHKISLGSLIIALGLLVDDAIIAVEMMVRKLEEGYDKVRAATFAYECHGDADAHRHADHRGRLPADRHGQVVTVGEYTFAIFAVTAAALLISGGVGLLRALPGRAAPAHARSKVAGSRTSCSTRRSTHAFARW